MQLSTVSSLCSLASMWRSILLHYLAVVIRAVKETCYTLIHLLTFYNRLKKSQASKEKNN